MLIDSHCHLHDREFFSEEEAEECLARAREAGVEKIICIGTNADGSLAACEFSQRHDGVYWTYGIHPENSNQRGLALGSRSGARPASPSPRVAGANPRLASLRTPLRQEPNAIRLVAIGEVGLDYHYEGYDRKAQIRLFEEMLQLAVDNDLPVSFHVREAFDDFFPAVGNFPGIRGVVHSFTDSKKVLRRILSETEFYIGVNGLATYSTLPLPPLERILLETDAPFLAPVPHRGEKNEPAYIAEVAKWLSEVLALPLATVEEVTSTNAEQLFRI